MTDPAAILDAAHAYARRGWSVLVLHHVDDDGRCWRKPGQECATYFDRAKLRQGIRERIRDVDTHRPQAGKHPVDARWQSQPPMSGPDVQASFEDYPGANVGLRTGHPSGFFVLDIDPDHDGYTSLDTLEGQHGQLPATYTVQTGSGGLHYYYALPDFEVTNSPGRLGQHPGIDIRGTGGQVVAAPSTTAKGAYTVLDDRDPVPAPAWLLDAIRPKPVSVAQPGRQAPAADLPAAEVTRLAAYAERAVQRILDDLPGVGDDLWDQRTYNAACNLIELANAPWNALTTEQAYALLFERAPRDHGFTDDDVNTKWLSAVKKIGDKARVMPAPRPDSDVLVSTPATTSQPDFFTGEPLPEAPQPAVMVPEAATAPGDSVDPATFFDRDGLQAAKLARHCLEVGPIAWGRDAQFWAYTHGVWRPDHRVLRNRTVHALKNRYRGSHATNVEDIARAHIPVLDFDPVPEVINFQNGLLDWRTGQLREHDADIPTTIQLPLEWDPDATCERFEAFLAGILAPETVQLVWEMIGYLMYSGNPLQVAFLLFGSGQNGKGTLLRVVEQLLGRENIASQTLDSLNNNRFAPANLFGKIANVAGDIDATFQESTAAFKKLTGEDSFDGERKHMDAFTFTSWAVPVFSANKIPGSADVTEGYTRRWVIVPFNRHIDDADKVIGLSDQLAAELPGIAAKAMPALRTVLARRHFERVGEVAAARETFVEAIDQARQWLNECTMSVPGATVLQSVAYSSYRAWCDRNGVGKLKASEFYARLEQAGHPTKKRDGARMVQDVAILELKQSDPYDYSQSHYGDAS